MASAGRVRLRDIRKALDACLPGCRWEPGKHRWHVYPPNGDPPFYLPQGRHGANERAEIERGHVKRMARQFGVLDPFKDHIQGL